MSLFLSQALKPFVLVAYLCAVYCLVYALRRWMPECRLKRLLLYKLWD